MSVSVEALRLDKVVKAYGPTLALGGASLSVRAGEVHALLGENGAGKSTTVKLLSGLIRPSLGSIRVFGETVRLARPADAHALGVQTAFQEISLVRDLTVADNMLMPDAPVALGGLLRRRQGRRLVAEHLERLGLGGIDPGSEVGTLDLPQRQKVEIARAVFRRPRILLLDEPTSALWGGDIDWLAGLVGTLKADGITTIFISHRMAEVRRFCDRLTVLRNGVDAGTAAVALAAIGQTFVVLTGGFDLSAGAVVSLVNVVLGAGMGTDIPSQILFGLAALGIGAAVGAVNGFFVAYVRMQPIVVTLATMFIVQGATLLVADKPGGSIPPEFVAFLGGDAIPGILPAPVVVVALGALVWLWARTSRFGIGLYAVGSDEDAAFASGVPNRWVKFRAYVLAGAFYGAAGAFVSAQTGSADPLVGRSMLLEIFAAVALGGTVLGGGRGGAIGSVIGAYTLMIAVNILLVLNVPAFYSSVAEGMLLILAVLGGSFGRRSPLAGYLRLGLSTLKARRSGTLAAAHWSPPARPKLADAPPRPADVAPSWFTRNRETLKYTSPAYLGLILVVLATQALFGNTITNPGFFNALVVLSSFLAILALGQGTAILTGGLDLSLPWIITLVGILVAGLVRGSDLAALWAIPLGLAVGVGIGVLNGLGIVLLGLPPIVMMLAMNGILQGAALVYSNGTPDGFASPGMRWLMTGHLGVLTPVVLLVVVFAAGASVLLGRTVFGRKVYAVGNSPLAARFSGVGVGGTLIGAYALSGFCAALVGILLAGFSGQASLGMGDEYLLPSIAAVVVGGTLITGGRGQYLGMLGGVLLLTALSTLLSGTMLPHAVQNIVFGVVVLGAVLALRD